MIRRPELEINFSMQNMVDASSALWAPFAPIEVYTQIAQSAGYAGVEYYPFRVPHVQVTGNLLTQKALDAIHSGHQSFRTERTFREVRNHPNPVLAMQAYLTMPEKFESLRDLQRIQQLRRKQLLAVVYPPNEWMGEKRPARFDRIGNKLIQPAPELLGAWSVNSTQEFAEEAERRGYRICLDLFHIRRNPTQGFENKFDNWRDAIPVLLPRTREIHLGVGRTDFQGQFDSMLELADLYYFGSSTEIIPMLQAIRDFGWTGPIVTEIPARSAAGLVSGFTTPGSLIKAHRRIVNNVRSIMNR